MNTEQSYVGKEYSIPLSLNMAKNRASSALITLQWQTNQYHISHISAVLIHEEG